MRKHTLSILATLALLFTFINPATAQIQMPAASPTATLSTQVGLTDVKIVYSRPSKKGRDIFSENGLVPTGKIWRTGANAATKIMFSDDVKVGDQMLEAGTYAILTMPKLDQWAVHFYPYESSDWSSYVEAEPAAAVMAEPSRLNHSVETFTIGINHQTMNGAHLTFAWDMTMVAVPIEVEVMDRVQASINQTLAGPTWYDYYLAAVFMHDTETDMDKAKDYILKATSMSEDDPRYWVWRRQALIMADMGDRGGAVDAAQKSMMLAQEAGNEEFVRLNEQSIIEWGGR